MVDSLGVLPETGQRGPKGPCYSVQDLLRTLTFSSTSCPHSATYSRTSQEAREGQSRVKFSSLWWGNSRRPSQDSGRLNRTHVPKAPERWCVAGLQSLPMSPLPTQLHQGASLPSGFCLSNGQLAGIRAGGKWVRNMYSPDSLGGRLRAGSV